MFILGNIILEEQVTKITEKFYIIHTNQMRSSSIKRRMKFIKQTGIEINLEFSLQEGWKTSPRVHEVILQVRALSEMWRWGAPGLSCIFVFSFHSKLLFIKWALLSFAGKNCSQLFFEKIHISFLKFPNCFYVSILQLEKDKQNNSP